MKEVSPKQMALHSYIDAVGAESIREPLATCAIEDNVWAANALKQLNRLKSGEVLSDDEVRFLHGAIRIVEEA